MFNVFLFAGLPYLAVFTLVAGSIYRHRKDQFSYSALSSQFLEGDALLWGSVPWHIGVGIVLLGHLPAFLVPNLWRKLMSWGPALFAAEAAGFGAALLCLAGLTVLLFRRILSAHVRAVSHPADIAVVVLLLLQAASGISVAAKHQWGAAWSTGTTTPYLWSLLTLRPDISYVADMPPFVKIHLTGAWLLFLITPFSRLVHAFALPFSYLFRPPQRVIWTNGRKKEAAPHE